MIERLSVRNFKSLANFQVTLSKFNCLVGMNGAGKSSVLQAIDFLAQLMEGGIDDWLNRREWTSNELNCKLRAESNIWLAVQYRTISGDKIIWGCVFNRHELLCSSESVTINGVEQLRVKSKHYRIGEKQDTEIKFKYQGSIIKYGKPPAQPGDSQRFDL